MIALLLGCYRYFAVQATLVRGKFPPSRVGSELHPPSPFFIGMSRPAHVLTMLPLFTLAVSVIAFLVGALVVAATAVILAGRHTY